MPQTKCYYQTDRQRRIQIHGAYSWASKWLIDYTSAVVTFPSGRPPKIELNMVVLATSSVKISFDGDAFFGLPPFSNPTYTAFFGPHIYTETYQAGDTHAHVHWGYMRGTHFHEVGNADIPYGGYTVPTTPLNLSDSGNYAIYQDVEELMRLSNLLRSGHATNDSQILLVDINYSGQKGDGLLFLERRYPGGKLGISRNGTPLPDDEVTNASWQAAIAPYYANVSGSATSYYYTGIGAGGSISCSCTAEWEGGGVTAVPKTFSNSNAWGAYTQESCEVTDPGSQTIAGNSNTAAFGSTFAPRNVVTAYARVFMIGALTTRNVKVEWMNNLQAGTNTNSNPYSTALTQEAAGGVTKTLTRFHRRGGGSVSSIAAALLQTLVSEGNAQYYGNAIDADWVHPLSVRFKSAADMAVIKSPVGQFTLRGRRWDALSVHQEAERVLVGNPWTISPSPFTDPGWRAVVVAPFIPDAINSISQVGDALHIVVEPDIGTGHPGYVRAVENHNINTAYEYRFIKVRYRSVGSANQPLRLRLTPDPAVSGNMFDTNEYLDLTTGADGVWVEKTLDRLLPPGLPIPNYKTAPPSTTGRLKIENLAYGKTYEIEWVKGFRKNSSLVSVMPTLYGETDAVPTFGASDYYIEDMVQSGGAWVVEDLAPPRVGKPADPPVNSVQPWQDFADSQNFGHLIEGWGVGFGGGANLLDVDADGDPSDVTLRAQQMHDEISLYPGIGDVFNESDTPGEYGENTNLYFAQILGEQVWGPVVDRRGNPVTSHEIVVTEIVAESDPPVDAAEIGRATPDVNGRYVSPGNSDDSLRDVGSTLLEDGRAYVDPLPGGVIDDWQVFLDSLPTYASRKWIAWFIDLISRVPMELDSVRHLLAVAEQSSGDELIRNYYTGKWTSAFVSDPHNEAPLEIDRWIFFSRVSAEDSMIMLAKKDDNLVVYVSYDNGITAKELLTVEATSGALGNDGYRHYKLFVFENGSDIQYRRSGDGGNTWSAAANIKLNNADIEGYVHDMVFNEREGGSFLLLVKDSSDDEMKVLESFDIGATWRVVLS